MRLSQLCNKQFRKWRLSDEVVVTAVDAVVVVEVAVVAGLKTNHKHKHNHKLQPNPQGDKDTRETSTLTFHQGCGWGVQCILSGGAKVISVQNLKLAHGRM